MRLLLCLTIAIAVCGTISCNDAPNRDAAGTTNGDTSTAESWALVPFSKVDSANPILAAGNGIFFCPVRQAKVEWEEKDVFNPAVIVKDGKIIMLYRAEDSIGKYAGTSRIGLAESTDGIHFTRRPEPVFFPDNDAHKKYEWEGGCEDPRLVQDSSGTYFMTYTAYDGKLARLLVASSKDLLQWTKHGPAFAKAQNGKYVDKWSKSGSIVSVYGKDGNITAAKINGKYWMYWGDVNINIATSDDLIHWAPVEMSAGEKPPVPLRHNSVETPDLKLLFGPRNKYFDSDIVEPGPAAMLREDGILLIYNGRNVPQIGDSTLAEGTYAAGQVLIDKNDPTRVISRMEKNFLRPDKAYEMTGQVNHVCFVEGLAFYKDKWFLYFGTADSKIAVAVK